MPHWKQSEVKTSTLWMLLEAEARARRQKSPVSLAIMVSAVGSRFEDGMTWLTPELYHLKYDKES